MAERIEDPIDTPEARAADFRTHVRTYYGFLHVVRWFAAHIGLLLVAIYGYLIGQGVVATLLVGLAVAALCVGIVTTPGESRRKLSHLPPSVEQMQRG